MRVKSCAFPFLSSDTSAACCWRKRSTKSACSPQAALSASLEKVVRYPRPALARGVMKPFPAGTSHPGRVEGSDAGCSSATPFSRFNSRFWATASWWPWKRGLPPSGWRLCDGWAWHIATHWKGLGKPADLWMIFLLAVKRYPHDPRSATPKGFHCATPWRDARPAMARHCSELRRKSGNFDCVDPYFGSVLASICWWAVRSRRLCTNTPEARVGMARWGTVERDWQTGR